MSERKPSRLQRFWGYIAKKGTEKQIEYQDEKITGNAIRIVADRKLENRLEEYKILLDLLEEEIKAENLHEYVTELKDMVKTMHSAISRIAGPYARSGDNLRFAKLMHGWNRWYASAMSKCERVDKFFATGDGAEREKTADAFSSINSIAVHNLHMFLIQHVFPDAFDVLNYCFRDADVRERAVTVIQTMVPQQSFSGGPIMTDEGQ